MNKKKKSILIPSYLNILRNLVDNQQFKALEEEALANHQETGDIRGLPLLALAHVHQGEIHRALGVYEKAASRKTELDADARIDLAGVDCVLMRIDNAVELLEPILEQQPDHALGLARLAWCRMQQGRLEEARELYTRSAGLKERLPVLLAMVRLDLQAEKTEAAQKALDRAIACLETRRNDLPEISVSLFTAQLRGLQLEIWVTAKRFAEAEAWLAERRADIEEEAWTALLTGYALLLAGNDRHSQAEDILKEGLGHYPDSSAMLMQLASLALVQGHFAQADRALRRAARFDPDNPEIWCRVADANLHRAENRSRRAAEKATKIADSLRESDAMPKQRMRQLQARAKTALAGVELHDQNFDKAETLFREVLEENPYFVPALQGLAQQYMQQGHIDGARELYEKVKLVDPLAAHASLINIRSFPEDIETLERMEKAAEIPSLEGSVRQGLLFQLAAAWHDRKDHEKAFGFVNRANQACRAFLSYDAKKHRNQCARIRHAFTRSLYDHRKDCGVESSLPVYVLGMPRSGTTLVEQIISGHSRIFGAGELGVIPQRISGLNRWERRVGSGRRYPDCIDDLTPEITKGIAKSILDELKALAEKDKPEAQYVVDKLPHNFENIGFIKFLFPNAKIISVRRDPRDIAVSNYFMSYQARHGGMGFTYNLTEIGEQLADHNLLMHHWQQVFPGEILEIQYEAVVDDLEGSARRILDYIGVEWEPQVLGFNTLDRPVKTASIWQVRQPIYKTSKAKWKRYEKFLGPLIKGANAKITWDPIDDMLTLPEPGFLQNGVELFRRGKLDDAEMSFKKMLHHNPEHAACTYMVGLVYCSKGHIADGIPLLEIAVKKCPWHREWKESLARAYRETGRPEKAEEVLKRRPNLRRQNALDESAENLIGDTFSDPISANG